MSEEISEPMEKQRKKRTRGRPKKGDKYSLLDKKERIAEAAIKHASGYDWVEVREWLMETYDITKRTASSDIKAAAEIQSKKLSENLQEKLAIIIDILLQEIYILQKEAKTTESDIARVQFRKLLKENRTYLWENFFVPDHFKALRSKDSQAGEVSGLDLVAMALSQLYGKNQED